jgi:hypothetical protein
MTSTDKTVTVSDGTTFSAGQTLRINTEQMYVYSTPAGATVPVQRAVNGTTAVTATTGTSISVYQYPGSVTHAVLIATLRAFKRRESGYTNVISNPIMGTLQVWKGEDPDWRDTVNKYVKVRRGYYL